MLAYVRTVNLTCSIMLDMDEQTLIRNLHATEFARQRRFHNVVAAIASYVMTEENLGGLVARYGLPEPREIAQRNFMATEAESLYVLGVGYINLIDTATQNREVSEMGARVTNTVDRIKETNTALNRIDYGSLPEITLDGNPIH